MMHEVPQGWYPDPGGSGGQRFWDGQRWTEQLRPDPQEVVLSQLPPPSQVETAVAEQQGWGAAAEVERRGSSRSLLLLGACVVLLLIGGGVAAVIVGGGTSAASGDRLADLGSEPQVSWSVAGQELYAELIDEIVVLSRDEPWLPSAAEIREEGDAGLAEQGHLRLLGSEADVVVVQPFLYDIAGPLLGLDPSTGEQVWSSGPLRVGRDEPGYAECSVAHGARAYCVSGRWDEALGQQRGVLRAFSLSDGSIAWQQDLATSDSGYQLATIGADAVILRGTEARGVTVARYGADGSLVFEEGLAGEPWSVVLSIVGELLVLDTWDGEFEAVVLDPATGARKSGFPAPGSRGNFELSYREQNGVLLRQELRDGQTSGSLARLDDTGREVWRTSVGGSLAHSEVLEPGAPLLIREDDGSSFTALDPQTGEELWRTRLPGDDGRVRLSSARDIVVTDDRKIVVLAADDGQERWSRPHFFDGWQRPVYAATNYLYSLEDGFRLRAYALRDGEEQWSWVIPDGHSDARLHPAGDSVLLVRNEHLDALR